MKSNWWCVLPCCSAASQLTGQEEVNRFTIADNGQLLEREAAAPQTQDDKYRTAKAVYDRLVDARGDYRYPVPEFRLDRKSKYVAYMDYDAGAIGLEERAYDVAVSFGEDFPAALASLLAHELIHFYEKHAWRRGFVQSFRGTDVGTKLNEVNDDLVHETQADYLGGFLAYSAGFPRFERQDEFLERVYEAYGLQADIGPQYPVLPERQAMSRYLRDRVARLVEVFEVANYLVATGDYELARAYYQRILTEYQSREIYNNLGVLSILLAVRQFSANELQFVYPLEIDLNAGRATRGESTTPREAYLHEAIRYFDYGIGLDDGYAPAYLNKACAWSLLDDQNRARFYAELEARPRSGDKYPQTAVDVDVLLGILAAREGDPARAEQLFTQNQSASPHAAQNLARLKGEAPPAAAAAAAPGQQPPEAIDGVQLPVWWATQRSADSNRNQQIKKTESEEVWLYQQPSAGPQSRIYISHHMRNLEEKYVLFHATQPGYAGQTGKGLGVGATLAEIEAAYGAPERTLSTPRGSLVVYGRLLFVLDAAGRVERWVNVYRPT